MTFVYELTLHDKSWLDYLESSPDFNLNTLEGNYCLINCRTLNILYFGLEEEQKIVCILILALRTNLLELLYI